MFFWAKYGTETTFTFPILKRAVIDLAATADWTPATGDTKVSKDGGNVANTTNNPAAVGGTGSVLWTLTLTATELQAAVVDVQIVDSATKTIEDQVIKIFTYGNASAKIVPDLSDIVRMGLTALPNAAAEASGGLYTRGSGAGQINQAANGQIDSNVVKVAGTAQTGRDLGASVLISSGTGTGQLDVTSGVIKANLVQILATAVTETVGGYLAAGFKKLFDVAAPVFTTASVNQTGDSYAKVDTEIAAIKAKTDLIPASPAQEGTLSTIGGKVDSALADTNMLQVDWVNGGRLDLLIDGIKAKTDLIPASPAAVGSKMDIVDAPSATGKAALANAAADQVWDEVASGHVASGSTGALLALVHSILGGKQQIIGNQLVCYAADNATEVARFNLFDAAGDPTMVSVYLRTRA